MANRLNRNCRKQTALPPRRPDRLAVALRWTIAACMLTLCAGGITPRLAAQPPQAEEVAQPQPEIPPPLAPPLHHVNPNAGPAAPAELRKVREIYIPFEDMNIVLEGQTQRIFLSRAEYESLLQQARKKPVQSKAPLGAVPISADYQAVIDDGRALIRASIRIDVLADGVQAVPLELSGLGIRSASVDGRPAALGHGPPVTLFVEGRGRKQLVLELLVPMQTATALQTLHCDLPIPSATRMQLTVPGNVELKSGAEVLDRALDPEKKNTRFELLLRRGAQTLVMTLNNRQLLKDRVVVARSVMVDEVTQAYERLHSTMSLAVLHGAIDKLRLGVPPGFEVTEVQTPLLSKWNIEQADGKPVLEVVLREATSEMVVIHVTATRVPPALDAWSLPQLVPMDVAGHVAVVGLLVEDRLQPYAIQTESLLPLQTGYLTANLPQSVFQAEPGAPQVRPIVAYYSPRGEFSLQSKFRQPPMRLNVTTNALLVLSDTRQELQGLFVVYPEAEKLFTFDFAIPDDWALQTLTGKDGQPLLFEQFRDESGARARVTFPSGIPAGMSAEIRFRAQSIPKEWLGDWTKSTARFPRFTPRGADRDEGAIAISAIDDIKLIPEELQGLVPLDEAEKARYGLAGVGTDLIYRYDNPMYAATFVAERAAPTITARTFTFARILPDQWRLHYELAFDIQDSQTDRLSLLLPGDTPPTLGIRGLDQVVVKEFNATETERNGVAMRRWDVLLAQRVDGRVRLTVEFPSVPRDSVPMVLAADVAYQTSVVTVEGHADLDTEVRIDEATRPRKVDIGELAAADYEVGRRVLASVEFVGQSSPITVRSQLRSSLELPSAIVQRAELVTMVSTSGVSQTVARFNLRTKATYLEVELPKGAALWSIFLDGTATTPQQENDRLLVSLPADSGARLRDLQVVYELPVDAFMMRGTIEAPAPGLHLRDESGKTSDRVPLADLKWRVRLPSGFRIVKVGGSVFPDYDDANTRQQLAMRESPWNQLGRSMVAMSTLVSSNVNDAVASATSRSLSTRYYSAEPKSEATPKPASGEDLESALHGMSNQLDRMSMKLAPKSGGGGMGGMGGIVDGRGFGAGRQPASGPMGGQEPGASAAGGMPGLVPQTAAADPPKEAVVQHAPPLPPTGKDLRVDEGRVGYVAGESLSGKDERRRGRSQQFAATWALEGVRSLRFDFDRWQQSDGGQWTTFLSLGEAPILRATLVDARRLHSLGWAIAIAIGLAGLFVGRMGASTKLKFVGSVLLLSTVLPLVTPWMQEVGLVCDYAFWAAITCLVAYMVWGIVRWCAGLVSRVLRRFRRAPATAVAVAATAAICGILVTPPAPSAAQENAARTTDLLQHLIGKLDPVKIPEDAVLIPYNSDDPDGWKKAERIMVPLSVYQALWNQAHPEQKPTRTPVPFAWAGASYQLTLQGDSYAEFTGRLELDLFTDDEARLPLAIVHGVLTEARVDGQPARVVLVESPPAKGAPAAPLFTLSAVGKGRKTVDLTIRMPITRRGGWRIVNGQLPHTPAASLSIAAPEPKTEVRLAGIPDKARHESDAPNQKIETSLTAGESFTIQWRPKVSEAEVDRSLTAVSQAELEVREDALRLAWQLQLEFPRSRRESFSIRVPTDYLVERVSGSNVKGWSTDALGEADERGRLLEVTLLKAAQDKESIVLHLSRRDWLGKDDTARFPLPLVTPADAMQHQGTLVVARSPILDLKVSDLANLAQTDLVELKIAGDDAFSQGVLLARPFQAFRFAAANYRATVSARSVESRPSAEFRTILRIAERESRVETQVAIQAKDRTLFRIDLALPKNLKLESVVVPGSHEWVTSEEAEHQLLTIYLHAGIQGDFSINLEGSLGARRANDPVSVPPMQLLNVARQTSDIVVQADPAYDVNALESELKDLQVVTLDRTYAWLSPEQRSSKRLALQASKAGYQGTLAVTRRKPEVSCLSVTNIRISGHNIRETILLRYDIQNSGIRELVFQLPAALRSARIKTALMRQKTVQDADPGSVRVRVDLQDEVMGELKVLIESDRLLTGDNQASPIPVLESVDLVEQQLVAFESSGRDELVFDTTEGMQLIESRENSTLAGLLGTNYISAYKVTGKQPNLTYHLKGRRMVETVGARVGFGLTELRLDGHGAYRAKVTYYVENTIEQFLVVQLPSGASLWTAMVDQEVVRPSPVSAAGTTGQVRIPIVKTALGDPPYPVVLTYAGKLATPGNLTSVKFPLMRTVNINAELSHVRLLLPSTHRWVNFDGTLGRVTDKGEFQSGFLDFRTRQVEQILGLLQSDVDSMTVLRCENNLKQLGFTVDEYTRANTGLFTNERFREKASGNKAAQVRALQRVSEVNARQSVDVDGTDNRVRWNDALEVQQAERARNVVSKLGRNFFDVAGQEIAKQSEVNVDWFSANNLAQRLKDGSKADRGELGDHPDQSRPSRVAVNPQNRAKPSASFANSARNDREANPVDAPVQLFEGGAAPQPGDRDAQGQSANLAKGRRVLDLERDSKDRYQQRLQLQTEQQRQMIPQAAENLPQPSFGIEEEKDKKQLAQLKDGASDLIADVEAPDFAPLNRNLSAIVSQNQAVDQSPATPYLRSLQVELPERGVEFLFTTPRGELELTAQAIDASVGQRSERLGIVVGVLCGLVVLSGFTRGLRRRFGNA